jgi:hypothetical protein
MMKKQKRQARARWQILLNLLGFVLRVVWVFHSGDSL